MENIFLGNPEMIDLLKEAVRDGAASKDGVSIKVLPVANGVDGNYFLVPTSRVKSEIVAKLNAALERLNLATKTHKTHPEVVAATQQLINLMDEQMERVRKDHFSALEFAAEMPRIVISGEASRKAGKRVENDPRTAAMAAIKAEFTRWQDGAARYATDAAFAKAMHVKHAATIKNESSIKNACTRWRRDRKSSS